MIHFKSNISKKEQIKTEKELTATLDKKGNSGDGKGGEKGYGMMVKKKKGASRGGNEKRRGGVSQDRRTRHKRLERINKRRSQQRTFWGKTEHLSAKCLFLHKSDATDTLLF